MKKKVYPVILFVVVFVGHAGYIIRKTMLISSEWVQLEEVTPSIAYLKDQNYLLGLSYALASAFTVYAVLKFIQDNKRGISGAIGGITLTGVIYFGGCFLLGCCGSPMLIVYLNLFGSSFMGFTKPLTFILTLISVVIGFFWIEKKTKTANCCCSNKDC